jgi:hypothetical protein
MAMPPVPAIRPIDVIGRCGMITPTPATAPIAHPAADIGHLLDGVYFSDGIGDGGRNRHGRRLRATGGQRRRQRNCSEGRNSENKLSHEVLLGFRK